MSMMHVRWGRLYRGTPAELSLEDAVCKLGIPYRTQYPGFLFGVRHFPDFYFPTIGVILEVDDPSHNRADKRLADAERTETFEHAWGVRVCRTTNEEALNNPDEAVRAALATVGAWPLPHRTPRLAGSLPQPKSCPQKIKRDLAVKARREGRSRKRVGDPTPPKRKE